MKDANADLNNPLMRGLACAALDPGLRSVLVFDGAIATLQSAAHTLAQMLEVVTDYRVVLVQLGVVETEDDLWGGLALSKEPTAFPFEWQRGILASGREQELRLIIIPDLTKLSLATARACIALMGIDVAYLERHGHQDAWKPNLCWIAGCSRSEVGLVSPHLLDRFALRLSSREFASIDRAAVLRQWLQELNDSSEQTRDVLSPEWVEVLKRAHSKQFSDGASSYPEVTLEAQKRVLDYIAVSESYSVRRELALLRLAQANAQLDGVAQVSAEQVDRAARMVGLKQIEPSVDADSLKPEESIQPEPTFDRDSVAQDSLKESQPLRQQPTSAQVQEPVYKSDTTETLPSQSMVMEGSANPYPEDTAPVQREAASLRLPIRRFKNAVSGRGAIVGVEPATVPQDLAIVSTLLEAAKYQLIRRSALLKPQEVSDDRVKPGMEDGVNGGQFSHGNEGRSLILQPTDLRRYRRVVVPEQMLAMVLDYTCLQDCKWQESLLPYWQWAYEERASVCLIQVGAANARHELQAEKITADKVLVPRIRLSLGVGRGRATPLAHGLDLVLQTLRHALQHGRSATQQAVLVVLSDGRGNVPLEASRTGKVTPPVGRQGIEDALQVARKIAGLNDVKSVVLNPQPKHYKELPVTLAQALGAKIAEIPPLKAWEVEE